jgi:hypothetical protein
MNMFLLTLKNQAEKVRLADITSLRISFAVASLLIIIGVTLAHFVHTGFLALPLLVAGGLSFSALAGWCPMSIIIEKYFVRK